MSKVDEMTRNAVAFYAIKDEQLTYFSVPFCCANDREACAIVRNSIEPNSALSKHRDCFSLFKVGIFHDDVGVFEAGFVPYKIIRIEDLINGVVEDTDER